MSSYNLTNNFYFLESIIDNKLYKGNDSDEFYNKLDQIVSILHETIEQKLDSSKSVSYNDYSTYCSNAWKIIEIVFLFLSPSDMDNLSGIDLINYFFNRYEQWKFMKNYIFHIKSQRNSSTHVYTDRTSEKNILTYFTSNEDIKMQTIMVLKYLQYILLWFVHDCLKIKEVTYEKNPFKHSIYHCLKSNSESSIAISENEKQQQKNELDNIYNDIEIQKFSIAYFLFKDNDSKFNIPIYQRGYSWSEKHVETLLHDIHSRMNDNNLHYFGVIAVKKITDVNKLNIYKLIDGQQRLTTSLILIKVLRDLNREYNFSLEENNQFKSFFRSDIKLEKKFHNPMQEQKSNSEFRYVLSNDYRKIFENYKNNPSQCTQNYLYIYRVLKGKIEEIKSKNDSENDEVMYFTKFVESFTRRFQIGIISLNELKHSPKLELEIFQNINSKGKELEVNELIKNCLINLCDEKTLIENDSINSENKVVISFNRSLESNNIDKKQLDNFYSLFCHYITGEEYSMGKDTKSIERFLFSLNELLKPIGIKSKDINLEEFNKVMVTLSLYLTSYLVIKNKSSAYPIEIDDSCISLIKIIESKKIVLFAPLLFLITELFSLKSDINLDQSLVKENINKQFKAELQNVYKCIVTLTKYIISEFILKGQGDSETKRFIFRTISNIRKDMIKDKEFTVLDVNKALQDKLFSNNYWEKNKDTLVLKINQFNEESWWVHRPLLLLIEYNLANIPSGQSCFKQKDQNITLEHIMPQTISPTKSWWRDIKNWNNLSSDEEIIEQHGKYLNKLGNLTLLNSKVNGQAQDSCFSKKIEIYEKKGNSNLFIKRSNPTYDISIQGHSKWGFKEISKRNNELIEFLKTNIFINK